MNKEKLQKLGLNFNEDRNVADLILAFRDGRTTGFSKEQLEILSVLKEAIEEYESTITHKPILQVVSPVIAAKLLFQHLRLKNHEEVCVMFLDAKNNLISIETLFKGGFDKTCIDHRFILSRAFELHARSMLLAHNHLNGDPRPSHSDINGTDNFKKACSALGFELLDHIIISDDSWYSFKDESCHAITEKGSQAA